MSILKEKVISFKERKILVPEKPIIPFIEGDGIGPDIMQASLRVFNRAVEKAYKNQRKISWLEVFAGEKGFRKYKNYLPEETLDALKYYKVAIKGPLTTPVGKGFRSLNVAIRQKLDLYACIRPITYFKGVPSPVKHPEKLNLVIFRENTEDVYAGIEWEKGTKEAKKIINYLKNEFGVNIRTDSGIGIKPISEFATKRLVRKAIQYTLENKRKSITLMHKGNIMKYTEGAFREWGYELAKEEFRDSVIFENEISGKAPEDKIIIKDRIADSIFQQVLTRPDEYDIIATPNLDGDYLSDACAAQVGGLGLAPGANIGDEIAVFESTHGSAPKYANLDKVNPGSLILSGVMLFDYLGWKEVSQLITDGMGKTILQKKVTYDLERQMENATLLSTSQFASAIIENME